MHANPIDGDELKKAQGKEKKTMQPISAEKTKRSPPGDSESKKSHFGVRPRRFWRTETEKKQYEMSKMEDFTVLENTFGLQDEKTLDKVTVGEIKKYMSRDFFLSHVSIALGKEGKQNTVKRFYKEFPGLEAYLYLRMEKEDGMVLSVFFDKWQFLNIGIEEEEAWKCAEQNIRKDLVIDSLEHRLFGADMPEGDAFGLYIVTNSSCNRGASGVLNREAMRNFALEHHCNQVMAIPSSIHEMLLLPHAERFDVNFVAKVIRTINVENVKPEDQLGNWPYILNF